MIKIWAVCVITCRFFSKALPLQNHYYMRRNGPPSSERSGLFLYRFFHPINFKGVVNASWPFK